MRAAPGRAAGVARLGWSNPCRRAGPPCAHTAYSAAAPDHPDGATGLAGAAAARLGARQTVGLPAPRNSVLEHCRNLGSRNHPPFCPPAYPADPPISCRWACCRHVTGGGRRPALRGNRVPNAPFTTRWAYAVASQHTALHTVPCHKHSSQRCRCMRTKGGVQPVCRGGGLPLGEALV